VNRYHMKVFGVVYEIHSYHRLGWRARREAKKLEAQGYQTRIYESVTSNLVEIKQYIVLKRKPEGRRP
jgi:hypothetical protein